MTRTSLPTFSANVERAMALARAATALLVLLAATLAAWAALASDVWFELHFTHTYCMVDDRVVTKLHVSRWIAGALAIVVVAVVGPRIVRRTAGKTVGSVAGSALRIGVALVLAFVVTDVFLRWKRARAERAAGPPPTVKPLFVHVPFEDADVVAGTRTFHIALNKDKVRRRTIHDDPDPDAPSIVFSGESVCFGYGLDYDESIPALVAAHTGIQTINLGVNGFANDEALEWLKASMARIKHPIAVVSFIVYNAIGRNIAPQRWHLAPRPGGGLELVKPDARAPGFLERSPLWTALHAAVPYHDARVVDLTREILASTAAYARSVNAYPLFVLTETPTRCAGSTHESMDDAPEVARRLAAAEGIAAIRVLYPPAMQIGGDVHPDPRGAAHFADAIERALRDAGVVH
jgi:hypothetical protein